MHRFNSLEMLTVQNIYQFKIAQKFNRIMINTYKISYISNATFYACEVWCEMTALELNIIKIIS